MTSARQEILLVAGEPSGDRIAARAIAALRTRGVDCFGIAGPASRAEGLRAISLGEDLAAMGVTDVLRVAPALVRGGLSLAQELAKGAPRAALLVNFTEVNQRLGRVLRALGTRVLWCVAPQVWAWRPSRLGSLRGAFDRLAVILPFEEKLWRDAGHDATYVGHPSWSPASMASPAGTRSVVAVLPGSRPGEVRRLSAPLMGAARVLLDEGTVTAGRLLVAAGLPARDRSHLRELATAFGLEVVLVDAAEGAAPHLREARVALCASGTASLEAALEGASPVIAYRMDRVAFALARRFVRTPHIGLPNVILGRRAFPELLQDAVTERSIASAARDLLLHDNEAAEATAALRVLLEPPLRPTAADGGPCDGRTSFGEALATLLLPWLAGTTAC